MRPLKLDTTTGAQVPQDTLPRRPRAVEYSDAYYKRLAVHRALSWAMLPLFAASYVSGDQLLSKGDDAPGWAKSVHPVAATGIDQRHACTRKQSMQQFNLAVAA